MPLQRFKIAAEIIAKHILTPVVYAYTDLPAEFIVFMSEGTEKADITRAEHEIKFFLGIDCEIIDIRSFDPCDIRDIISGAVRVYDAGGGAADVFEIMLVRDLETMHAEDRARVERRNISGTYFAS